MTKEQSKKFCDAIDWFTLGFFITELIVLVFAYCHLYTLSNEQIDSPGSQLFHSVAAGLGSAGCWLLGQAGGAIPLGVDSVTHLFDFFDAAAKQSQHDRSVASTHDTILWSWVLLVITLIVASVWDGQIRPKLEPFLVSLSLPPAAAPPVR